MAIRHACTPGHGGPPALGWQLCGGGGGWWNISHLWIPTWSVTALLAINGPDEKFPYDLLISFLSMKIGNIEKFAGGNSLVEILLDVLGCIEYSGRSPR